ncbi:hypothetical protein, partial [Ammoniphilus sp. 3BR4]|uniref:hypothetical protein n=1 Tax=Ammoniphilus sp. 3BR4 TaxID=3158265 RepID=UPI003467EB90
DCLKDLGKFPYTDLLDAYLRCTEELLRLKEEIKNLIVDTSVSWQQRIELYSKVRQINERLDFLTTKDISA